MTSVHSVPVHQGEQKNVDFCSRIVTLSAHTHFLRLTTSNLILTQPQFSCAALGRFLSVDLNKQCPRSVSPVQENFPVGKKRCTILIGQQHMKSGVVLSKDQVYTFLPLKCRKLIKTRHLKP